MPHYSVATTKDKLSSLIDKALAGEEVVITRHGKPTVKLNIVDPPTGPQRSNAAWIERLRQSRKSLPVMTTSHINLKQIDEDEGAL